MINDLLFYIRTEDYVSFAELDRWLEARGVSTRGPYCIEIAPGVVLWGAVSEQYCDIVDALLPHLELVPCSSLLVYMVDGMLSGLPIAIRPPKAGYKKPHWLPVTMRTKQRATTAEVGRAITDWVRETEGAAQ